MTETIAYLREFHFASVVLRLVLAMLLGGCIGLERERKRRPAGFRTYMLVCLGAALTVLLSLYEYTLVTGPWSALAAELRYENRRFPLRRHRSSTASAFSVQARFWSPVVSRSRD